MSLANDSQITLVNPTVELPLIFILSRDDVQNTVMRRRDGRGEVLYRIESDKSNSTTSLYASHSDAPIAVIEMGRLFGFDRIEFMGEKRRRIKDWISGYGVFQTFPKSIVEDGKRYYWRRDSAKRLALFSGHKSTKPIAWYERSKARSINGRFKEFPAFLAMEGEALQIQDLVVLSFLIVENQVRGRGE